MEKNIHQIWFISDTHFGHNRAFLYEPRGFYNIYKHDQAIIDNWNKNVNVGDDVYLLGDVMLNDNEYGIKCLKQLKGNIHIILGNHCTNTRIEMYKSCYNVVEVVYATIIKYKKFRFYLSHYPTLTANMDDGKSLREHTINLCGHCHSKDKFADWDKGLIYHVELDAHNNYPVSIEQIIEDLKEKYNG